MNVAILSVGCGCVIMLTTVIAAVARMRIQQTRRNQELLSRAVRAL